MLLFMYYILILCTILCIYRFWKCFRHLLKFFIRRVTVTKSSPYRSPASSMLFCKCSVGVSLNEMLGVKDWFVKLFPLQQKDMLFIEYSIFNNVSSNSLWYNIACSICFNNAIFIIQISLSRKLPHQVALDELNFHSILYFDRRPKMLLYFRIWLIFFAVVLKVFPLSLTMHVVVPFFAKNSLSAWMKSSAIIILCNFNWAAQIASLVKINLHALHPCFSSLYKWGHQSLLRLLWMVQWSVFKILVAYLWLELTCLLIVVALV